MMRFETMHFMLDQIDKLNAGKARIMITAQRNFEVFAEWHSGRDTLNGAFQNTADMILSRVPLDRLQAEAAAADDALTEDDTVALLTAIMAGTRAQTYSNMLTPAEVQVMSEPWNWVLDLPGDTPVTS